MSKVPPNNKSLTDLSKVPGDDKALPNGGRGMGEDLQVFLEELLRQHNAVVVEHGDEVCLLVGEEEDGRPHSLAATCAPNSDKTGTKKNRKISSQFIVILFIIIFLRSRNDSCAQL